MSTAPVDWVRYEVGTELEAASRTATIDVAVRGQDTGQQALCEAGAQAVAQLP